MNVPHMCARCGTPNIKALFQLKGTAVTHEWGWATSWLLCYFSPWNGPMTREKYAISVPLCGKCLVPVRRAHSAAKVLAVAGLLAGAAWLGVKGHQLEDEEFSGILSIVGVGAGAVIGWGAGRALGWIIQTLTATELGSFNGRYFRFRNKEFERQFGAMHPGWARPTRNAPKFWTS